MLGQALLAKRMGKKRIVAETGAGQHGATGYQLASLKKCLPIILILLNVPLLVLLIN